MGSFTFRRVINSIKERIQNHETLYGAVNAHADSFSRLERALIKTGEISGSLSKIYENLSQWFEFRMNLRKEFTGRLYYPLFLIHFAAVAIPLPVFYMNRIWQSYLSRILEMLGPTYVLVLCIAGIIFLKKNILPVRVFMDYFIVLIPGFRNLVIKLEMLRFCTAFKYAYAAGVSITETVTLSSEVCTNTYVRRKALKLVDTVERGESLSSGMDKTGMFPDLVIRLFETGEKGGKIEEMVDKTVSYYSNEVKRSLNLIMRAINFIIYFLIVGFCAYNMTRMFAGTGIKLNLF